MALADFNRAILLMDPSDWFFKAHFYQDPVCPGSFWGLESLIQMMKVAARERWKGASGRFESMALGQKHVGFIAAKSFLPTNSSPSRPA